MFTVYAILKCRIFSIYAGEIGTSLSELPLPFISRNHHNYRFVILYYGIKKIRALIAFFITDTWNFVFEPAPIADTSIVDSD